MTPFKDPICNMVLRAPGAGDLPALRISNRITKDFRFHTFWKPSAEELMQLHNGGSIVLTVVVNNHPPVAITVEP